MKVAGIAARIAPLAVLFCLSIAGATQPAWELQSDRVDILHDKNGDAVHLLENPLIFKQGNEGRFELSSKSAWYSVKEPSIIDVAGKVHLGTDVWSAFTDAARLDFSTGEIEVDGILVLVNAFSNARGDSYSISTSFWCQGGNLFIDGEDQGEVDEDNAVSIGGGSWWCDGDRLQGRIFFQIQ